MELRKQLSPLLLELLIYIKLSVVFGLTLSEKILLNSMLPSLLKFRTIRRCISRAILSAYTRSKITQPFVPIRCTSSSASPTKSIDELPGSFEYDQVELVRSITDIPNYWEEKYEIAKQYNPKSPMFKMNSYGIPSIALFSHDLVKLYQQYELKGQTRRIFPPNIRLLSPKSTVELWGPKHTEWRSKAAKAFKPNVIDQYTSFIQQSANQIVLEGISDITQQTGITVLAYKYRATNYN